MAYQSSTKAEEGLTQDAERIIETIRSCVRDEGINKQDPSGMAFIHSISDDLLC
jgi:hypothetical protein